MSDIIDRTREFVAWATQDDSDAMLLLDQLFFVAHLWDDLIDKDVERTAEEINRAFVIVLFDLPRNKFYVNNFHALNAVLAEVTGCWLDANRMENGELLTQDYGTAAAQAYTLRTLYNSMVVACARCIGGFDWAMEVSGKMRETSEFLDGTFDEYLETFRGGKHHG